MFNDKLTSAELLIVSTSNSVKRVLTANGEDTIGQLVGKECSVTEEALFGTYAIRKLTYKNSEIVKVFNRYLSDDGRTCKNKKELNIMTESIAIQSN